MARSIKYFLTGTGFILLLLQASCSTQRAIANYSGDGEIFAMPEGGFVQGGGGYQVRFERLRLDHPAHLTYRFSGLPKIAWRVNVFFAIDDSREWIDKRQYERYQQPSQSGWVRTNHFEFVTYDDLKGTLSMSLKDAKGNVIFDVHHKLSEFVWSGSKGRPWELYDRDSKMDFTPDSRKEYILEVGIEPDAILKDTEGYVLFRSGGHEGFSFGF